MDRCFAFCLFLSIISLVICAYDHKEAHREYALHSHCLAKCQWIPGRTTGCGPSCACTTNGGVFSYGICTDPNYPFPSHIAHSHYGFPEP
uniref:Putative secreted protein n=1 Tax=Amblyomma triste TaxID=251400 RepID=A0A023G3R9_AMBTT